MKNILSRAGRGVLERFACANVLLAFDYDGTLAPIVAMPERAAMRQTTRRLMVELTKLYPCIVISGRAQADALEHVRGIGVDQVVGNHGAEPSQAAGRLMQEVVRWRPLLVRRLSRCRGVKVEDKTFSVTVHYRQSREKKKARAAIIEAAAALGKVRIIGGKQIVNIFPNGAPNKGSALEKQLSRLGCDSAIYVGDDETDEDVFALDQPSRLLTIRVGAKRTSLASYYVQSRSKIDELLRVLIELRNRRGSPRLRVSTRQAISR